MRELFEDIVRIGRFVPVTSWQRFGYLCGALLMLGGVFHGAVYLVDGGAWEGPLSWRKPIVFGLSFGITMLTVTWFMSFLRPGRRAGWLTLGTFGVASLAEVFLISMQTWRGVASHFNEDTTFDALVFTAMGSLVSIVGLMTVLITVWAFVRLDAPASLALAIRLGLVLMLISQAVGVQMIVEGGNTFGAEGALKMPHAFTLHSAQVLPALALILLASPAQEQRRLRIVSVGAVGYAAIIMSTMVQAYAGHAPLDFTMTSTAFAIVGLALLATSAVLALSGLATRSRPPDAEQRSTSSATHG
ncbi:hypothetical protein [Aeromicrobium sp.]|uniref:hypothetical protein n=1 Tax=Aeromicrobium sp. TaxID=1871063 RepID=UPI003D6B93AA